MANVLMIVHCAPVTKFYRDSNKKKPFVKRITLAKMAADILEHVL